MAYATNMPHPIASSTAGMAYATNMPLFPNARDAREWEKVAYATNGGKVAYATSRVFLRLFTSEWHMPQICQKT